MDSHWKLAWTVLIVPALLLGCGREEPSQPATAGAPPPAAQPQPPKAAQAAPQVATPQAEPAQAPAPAPAAAAAEANAAALALGGRSGCLACHAVDHKVVGPAWKDVAARYRGDAGARSKLIEVVEKGGRGNWTAVTGGIAMPANAPRVSEQDIAKLVDFILSL